MEFYLHNKDDRKLKTLVNLGTTFKMDDINYIIYYNTQVEKSVIDIYIGKISYGDQCLVITKIESDKQTPFLNVVKDILAQKEPETEVSDYSNIIDTATIVLEGVQKIQIPTSSLDFLKKYHKNEEIENVNMSEKNDEETKDESLDEKKEEKDKKEQKEIDPLDFDYFDDNRMSSDENTDKIEQDKIDISESKETINESDNKNLVENENNDSQNVIRTDSKLTGLDDLLNQREEKKHKNKNKNKKISTPLLALFIFVIVVSIILIFVGNMYE